MLTAAVWTGPLGPPNGEVLTALHARTAIDGEIAVLTAEGIFDFEALQVAPGRSAKGRLVYVVFDICTSPDAIRARCRSSSARPSWRS